jgi:prepilin-type N-terminal cleavage/methylation domain-containing protein
MPASHRTRAFTLIEVMIVVVIAGVLVLLADVAYRRWVLNSYMGEAQNMVANIRTAEEAFRAENSGYLNVSSTLSAASLYPSTSPAESKTTQWGLPCTGCSKTTSWQALNVNPDGPVRFGYAVIADNTGTASPPSITVNGQLANLSSMTGQPWYIAEAICDMDNDSTTPNTTVYGVTGTNQLFVSNEGQ